MISNKVKQALKNNEHCNIVYQDIRELREAITRYAYHELKRILTKNEFESLNEHARIILVFEIEQWLIENIADDAKLFVNNLWFIK